MNKIIEHSFQTPIHANTAVKQAKLPQIHHQMNKFINNEIFEKNSTLPLELDFYAHTYEKYQKFTGLQQGDTADPKGSSFPQILLDNI